MKIDKSCKTCEFCFRDRKSGGFVCAGDRYDEPINTIDGVQPCWSISLNYWADLISKLEPKDKAIFEEDFSIKKEKKIFRAAGVDNIEDFLFHCIELLPEEE